jgi:hypothetical protein
LYDFEWTIVGTLACAMLLKMSILKMSSNTEIREKGECAAVRAVGQGLCQQDILKRTTTTTPAINWLLLKKVFNWLLLKNSSFAA